MMRRNFRRTGEALHFTKATARRRVLIRRVGALLSVVGLFVTLTGAMISGSAAVAGADTADCNGVASGSPAGSLHKSTVPAAGSLVTVGETIAVTATWNPADWSSLNKIGDCLYVTHLGVTTDLGLVGSENPPPNTGSWTGTSYAIPSSAVVGDLVCDRIGLSGNPTALNNATQKSDYVCFTVVGETTTSTSTTTTSTTTTSTTTAPTTTTTTSTTTAPTTTTTSTTTAPTTTTTSAPTTTTTVRTFCCVVIPSTTTVAPTTSTVPATTTTVGAQVLAEQGSTTVAPTTVAPTTAPPTSVKAVVLGVQGARSTLPFTGSDTRTTLLAAGVLLLLGGLLLLGADRSENDAK